MPEPLTCRELIEFLDSYCDGTLPTRRRAVFDEHLRICPECRGYLDEYRATIDAARSLGKPRDDSTESLNVPPAVFVAVRRSIGP